MRKALTSFIAMFFFATGQAQSLFETLLDLPSLSGYYRDWDINVVAEEGFGNVYVTKYYPEPLFNEGKEGVVQQTGPDSCAILQASVQAWTYLTNTEKGAYSFRLYAYPKPGYAFTGFVFLSKYAPGPQPDEAYVNFSNGERLLSGNIVTMGVVDEQTDSRQSPKEMSSYTFSPVTTRRFVAKFRPQKELTVTVTKAGTLEETVYGMDGSDADKLTVKGPLNEGDIAFLCEACRGKNLIRIDLSGARLTELPDNAFADANYLLELKLPQTGIRSIGEFAFNGCWNLLSFAIPQSVTYIGKGTFNECLSWGVFSKKALPKSRGVKKQQAERKDVYELVDERPSYPGGEEAMMKYLYSSLHYPLLAKERNIQGRVVIGFVVEKDGRITGAHVSTGLTPQLDYEALRVVKSMPKWIPGKKGGLPVATSYLIPISFRQ